MTTILGLGGSDHDVHACLIRDDRILVAIEEERLSRKKYGLGGNLLQSLARNHCLAAAGLELEDVDHIVADAILVPTALMGCRKSAVRVDHHVAHAAASWFTSGFDTGAVIVIDNAGGMAREAGREGLQATSWYLGEGRSLRLQGRVLSGSWRQGPLVAGQPYQRGDGDDSLGHLYKKITGALGFRFVSEGATDPEFFFPEDGITMGLAPFGDERHVEALWKLVELQPEGRYRIPLTDGRMDQLLAGWLRDQSFESRAAVARAGQEVLTRLLCHVVNHVIETTGQKNLCLSGGVAMNSVANGELFRRTAIERLHVPPMPGDNGTGIGAALWTLTRDPSAQVPSFSVYTGRGYSRAEVDAALAAAPGLKALPLASEEARLEEVAARLARSEVVAWFEGGSEIGRRALGHRSLLADPRRPEMRDFINNQVKHRQPFRPLAPVVLRERANEFFELPHDSPYMQIVVHVRPRHRETLGAVTHVDGTARAQTLRREDSPRLYRLLLAFEQLAGIPVLLNTSFNGKGEPIVETPQDALKCFQSMPIDALVLEDRLVVKQQP